MSSREEVKKELSALLQSGMDVLHALVKNGKEQVLDFRLDYQKWYSKSLPLVRTLAPDRYEEFLQVRAAALAARQQKRWRNRARESW